MSDTKEALKFSLTELGAMQSESRLSSVTSSERNEKLQELISSTPCQACRLMELSSYELKKQRENLKRTLLVHRKLEHENKSRSNDLGKETLPGAEGDDVADAGKKYNFGPLCNRLPFLKQNSGVHPPEPRVKRLKGELAKSVGRRIDGSDWSILHPDLCDSQSEVRSNRGH